jgi:hypothetical protein
VLNPSAKVPHVIHKVQNHIQAEGRPVAAKYRQLDPQKLAAAKSEFAKMEQQGIIHGSDSQWLLLLHMVRKPDGTVQRELIWVKSGING